MDILKNLLFQWMRLRIGYRISGLLRGTALTVSKYRHKPSRLFMIVA